MKAADALAIGHALDAMMQTNFGNGRDPGPRPAEVLDLELRKQGFAIHRLKDPFNADGEDEEDLAQKAMNDLVNEIKDNISRIEYRHFPESFAVGESVAFVPVEELEAAIEDAWPQEDD